MFSSLKASWKRVHSKSYLKARSFYSKISKNWKNKEALSALSKVESARGALPKTVRKQCDDYASEVLGSSHHAPWLYVYSAVQGRFKEGWIPDTYYANVLPNINGENRGAFGLAHVAHRFIEPTTVPDLLYIVNGEFFTPNYEAVKRSRVVDYLCGTCRRAVLKADKTQSGRGVQVLKATSFDQQYDDVKYGVIQRFVQQPELLAAFGSDAVATLRLTTVMAGSRPECRAAYLRLGSASDTHVKSTSQISVGVDIGTGAFHEEGWMSWKPVESHPDSHLAFSGLSFPKFKECLVMVKEQHQRLPFFGVIGWDVAVDVNHGPTIVEYNVGHPDVKFSEALHGPNFTGLGW